MRLVNVEPEAVQAAAAVIPEGVPVFMLNLLRFRAQADYGGRAGIEPCSGRDAFFKRYSAVVRQIMGDDSKLFWFAAVLAPMIAPVDEKWDDVALVEYRNFAAFRRLVEHPRYLAEAAFHRTAALEDSRLLASVRRI